MIPGPVFTTATFIGYVLGGAGGAVVATVGIFLPHSSSLPQAVRWFRESGNRRRPELYSTVLTQHHCSLMAVVTYQLARSALVDPVTVALLASGLVLIFVSRLNSAWMVLGGAAVGLILHRQVW